MKRFRLLAVAAALPLAMGACGPTIQTTLEPEWTVPVEMEQHETARVSAEGEAVVVADGKDVRIVDASDGDVVYEEEPEGGLLALLKDEVKLGGLSVSEIEGGDRYGYAFVPGSDLVLLFDNTLAEEEIRALGTATGEVTWRSDEYLWSLGQYGKAAEALLGGVLDGSARGASAPVLAFTKFVDDLSVPVPEKDALLINTVGDLVLADAATGRQIWSVPFGASGIGKALYLPESDDLLILARTRGLVESLTGAKRMMRVDAGTGEVMWSTSYAGQPVPKWVHGDSILDVRVIDDRVLLNFRGAEAYDLETGEQVFDALTGLHGALSSPTGGSVIGSAWTARPLIHDGVAYVHHAGNFKAVGYPDQTVRAYDFRTGERLWEAEPVESMGDLRDLTYMDGLLIGRVTGPEPESLRRGGALIEPGLAERGYVAWDAGTGSIVWSLRDLGDGITNLLAVGSALYGSDGDRILRLDPGTGEIAASVEHPVEAVGGAGLLLETPGGMAALSRGGIAFYTLPGLEAGAVIETGGIDGYSVHGDLLIARVGDGAYAIDLATGQQLGTVGNLGSAWTGNLRDGYHVTEDGVSLFVLHPDRVAKYPTP